jgi:hypothetical protein
MWAWYSRLLPPVAGASLGLQVYNVLYGSGAKHLSHRKQPIPCSINITVVGELHMLENLLLYLRADTTWPFSLLFLLVIVSCH